MTVLISKPAINIREQLAELKAQQGYEERQFHFDNLVTNGTFDTDTSGWTGSNATLSVSSGELVITSDVAGECNAFTSITTVAGQKYVISVDHRIGTVGQDLLIGHTAGNGSNYNGPTKNTDQTETATFVATVTTTYITIRVFSSSIGQYTGVDNISVYTSDGTDVAFTMPKGWKPLHVYDDGVLQREGSAEDYEVTFDGFNYYVKPTVANPGARNTVIGVRA
jgi:hypothetical protein